MTKKLGYMGTGYDMYLLSDLVNVNPEDYRIALLITAFTHAGI